MNHTGGDCNSISLRSMIIMMAEQKKMSGRKKKRKRNRVTAARMQKPLLLPGLQQNGNTLAFFD